MIFSYDDGVHGQEPWVTDGTAAGTFLLQDIAPGVGPTYSRYGPGPDAPLSSSPGQFAMLSTGLAAFSAYTPGVGAQPWITDGTPAGAERRMADLVFAGASVCAACARRLPCAVPSLA